MVSKRVPNLNPDWLVAQWPAPPHVHAVCTTRAGGISSAPFDSMNLGNHVGDDTRHVAQNREFLQAAIQATPVFLNQVHGERVVAYGQASEALQGTAADACVTHQPGVACTIMVADCLPVLFTNRQGTDVAAAHAGWRGLAGNTGPAGKAEKGVLEATLQQLGSLKANDILVWLGPCIGPEKFEVGEEVRNAFLARDVLANDSEAYSMFKPHGPGKWLANLAGLARLRLQEAGIENVYGNDGSSGWCTVSNPLRFFSHRRDARSLGSSGRMAACIWIS